MTVTIASTTDTESEVAEVNKVANTEKPVGDISSSQADGVPNDEDSDASGADERALSAEETDSESSVDVESSDDETDEVATEASAETDDETQEAVAEEEPRKKKKRRGRSYKDRASQLAREKAFEKQRADSLESQLQALERQREAFTRAQEAQPKKVVGESEASETAAAESSSDAAKGTEKPVQSDFDTYEDFSEALVDWKVSQRLEDHEVKRRASVEHDQVQAARNNAVAAHRVRIDAFRAENSDFDTVIEKAKDLPMTQPMQDSVINSEVGPAVMYHLSKNPEECDRIAQLHPMAAIKEMGKIEAQLEVASSGPTSRAEPVTRAPRPIKPVGGGATASTVALDKLPYQEYKKAREIALGIRQR
jgi:hypothetical protein